MKQSAECSNQKNPPWSKLLLLKEEKIPDLAEIIELAQGIDNGRNQALFILAYLTAGRIREIVSKRDKLGNYRSSIKKSDLKIVQEKGRNVLIINLRNEKNRNRKRKEIPVPLDIKENVIFWNMIIDYLNSLENDEELFHISYQNAYGIISKLGFNPHWIRHIRLTHLVTVYGYKEHQLIRYAGWTDSRPAKNYIEMDWTDLLYK